jgi:hypothetical protein
MHVKRSNRILLWAVLTAFGAPLGLNRAAAQPRPVSKGVYRLPYTNGTDVRFSNDHTNHPSTLNRVDMTGQDSAPYTVVAAGAGWIRDIAENNDTFCPNACGSSNDCDGNGVTTTSENNQAQSAACGGYNGPASFCCERHFEANGGTCPCPPGNPSCGATCQGAVNNYVWIEHPNGEWTKYTHVRAGSVGPGGAGRTVGEFVSAGTPIGIEGDVGIASGPHVHFEVAVPKYVELPPFNPLDPADDDPDAEPDDLDDWFSGGWLRCDECNCAGACGGLSCGCLATNVNRQNRIAVFCQIGFADGGDENTAGTCDDLCGDNVDLDFSGTYTPNNTPVYEQAADTIFNGSDLEIQPNAGVSLRAADSVTLLPGFHAELGSFFSASVGACDSPGGTGD